MNRVTLLSFAILLAIVVTISVGLAELPLTPNSPVNLTLKSAQEAAIITARTLLVIGCVILILFPILLIKFENVEWGRYSVEAGSVLLVVSLFSGFAIADHPAGAIGINIGALAYAAALAHRTLELTNDPERQTRLSEEQTARIRSELEEDVEIQPPTEISAQLELAKPIPSFDSESSRTLRT